MCEEIASREERANCSHPIKTVCFYTFYAFPRLRARFENSSKIALQLHWESHLRNNAFWDRFCCDLCHSWEPLGDLLAPRWPPGGPKDLPSDDRNLPKIAQEAPRSPQEVPKALPRTAKRPPRAPKKPPRGPQEGPQDVPKRPRRGP